MLNLAKRVNHWVWDPNEERKRLERWQQEQERLLQVHWWNSVYVHGSMNVWQKTEDTGCTGCVYMSVSYVSVQCLTYILCLFRSNIRENKRS